MGDESGLRRTIFSELVTRLGVAGPEVYSRRAPEGSTGAFAVLADFDTIRGERDFTDATDGGTQTTITVDCYGDTPDEAATVARDIRQGMTAIRGRLLGVGDDAVTVWMIDEEASRDLTNQRVGDEVDNRVQIDFLCYWNEEE